MDKLRAVESKILYGRDVATDRKARVFDAVLDDSGNPVMFRVKNGKQILEITMDDILKQCGITA